MQDSNQLPARVGWQRATVDWVEGHVLGLPGAASQPFFINNQALNPTAEASCLDIIATHYVGSIDNQDPLALLLSGVNGAKGKWLAGDVNIAAAGNNLKQDMNNIREVQFASILFLFCLKPERETNACLPIFSLPVFLVT